MSLLQLQTDRCKEQSAVVLTSATQDSTLQQNTQRIICYVHNNTTHAVQHGNISSHTAALGLLNAVN